MRISTDRLQVFDPDLPDGTPVAYEIVNGDMAEPMRGLVHTGMPTELHLDAGTYEIRLSHPDLGTIRKVMTIDDSDSMVSFGEFEQLERMSTEASIPTLRGESLFAKKARRKVADRVTGGTLGWWRFDQGAWSEAPAPPIQEVRRGVFQIPRGALDWIPDLAVQVVIPGLAAMCARVPPGTEFLEVRLRYETYRSERRPHLAVSLRTRNGAAESLLGYMHSGQATEADLLRRSVSAEQLLEADLGSPAAAAVGALLLLRTGEAYDFEMQIRKLAGRLPSDGGVALGTLLAQMGRFDEAHHVLVEAARCGPPVYLESMQALYDALISLGVDTDDPFEPRPIHPAIEEALRGLRPYSIALDRTQRVTTWACNDTPSPREPKRDAPTTAPPHGSSIEIGG